MTWDESEHPRDELGRFTSKGESEEESEEEKRKEREKEARKNKKEIKKQENEANKNYSMIPFKLGVEYTETRNQTPAEILLGNSTTAKENKTKKERNNLLKTLGNKLTPAQVLYSSVDELKRMANEKMQKITEDTIGENYNTRRHNAIKLGVGDDTAGMLDIAHGEKMIDKNYLKDAIEYKNYNETSSEDKEYLKNKIEQQFGDYGFNIENIKGYEFKSNSEPSKRISQNEDFKEILKNNKEKILKGENFSGRFEKHGPMGIFNNNDLKNAIGGFDVRNVQFDKNGNLHLKIYDTYDFNKNADDFLNKAGRHEMEAGNLKPFFSIHDIIIPKEEIEKIFERN